MNFDFIKVGTFTPEIKVADVEFNLDSIKKGIDQAVKENVKILTFPELVLTGYTAGDLFYSSTLLDSAKSALMDIANYTTGKNVLVFVGLPIKKDGLIYNVAAGISDGVVLGIVPKSYLPNYSEFYEKRYFSTVNDEISYIKLGDGNCEEDFVPFGKNIIFVDEKNENLKIAVEICEDLWTVIPPSISHAVNGANIVVNLSALPDFSGKLESRRELIKSHSNRIVCGYIYTNAGYGESSSDCVFSGHNLIAEDGEILAESEPFSLGLTTAEIDLSYIDYQRSKIFNQKFNLKEDYLTVGFSIENDDKFTRKYDKTPFIKEGEEEYLIDISAYGLKKRIEHINAKKLIIGVSGGLDSTLALIVSARALELLNRPKSDIIAITMPCFGTSERTFDNSIVLAKVFGATLKKIDISKAVKRHLKDISHPEDLYDACYENSQARERTQVLMDLANTCDGIVVGTGDLSELALGFATYNGDHMSMYAVNASIPKTLVRHLVSYTAKKGKGKLRAVLKDVLDTPVSPELLPSTEEKMSQITEDIVGPYILHDFFLYNIVKRGFSPKKTYQVAVNTFLGEFDEKTILKWLKIFVRRFFSQQFKRSCLPDGVKVSSLSLSPRGSYRMPSDAVSKLWLKELENIDE